MRILVSGQEGDGPVMQRLVTVREFVRLWGPWARSVLQARADRPFTRDGRSVWIELVD